MNIVQSIKQFWAADAELSALLPPENVVAARVEGKPVYPYAVITFITKLPVFNTNKAHTDRELFQISVFAERLPQARKIMITMAEVLRDAQLQDEDGNVVMVEMGTGELTFTEGSVTSVVQQFTVDTSKSRRRV